MADPKEPQMSPWTLPDGRAVRLAKSGRKVLWIVQSKSREFVGPPHPHVAAAFAYGLAQGWNAHTFEGRG